MIKVNDFAELLGVEIEEEFQFDDNDSTYASTYRITEEGIERFNEYTNTWGDCDLNINFIFNKNITKKPWKPMYSDMFYVIDIRSKDIIKKLWAGTTTDYLYYATGNCFKTKEEAIGHREEIISHIKSIYEDGR